MTSTRLVQVFLGAMIAVLVAAGLYTSAMIRERQNSLQSFFRYNVAYSASQAVVEFERFQNALLRGRGQRSLRIGIAHGIRACEDDQRKTSYLSKARKSRERQRKALTSLP